MRVYPVPDVAVLELTYRCNHRCFFCSCPWEADPDYRGAELDAEEWKKVIRVLKQAGVASMTLTGGEAIVRDDIKEIIDFLDRERIPANLISNGRRLDDDLLEFLSKRDITLSVSVPGIDTFAETTGVDNLDNVLEIFSKAKALGIETTANITVTKRNLPELYENIALPLIKGADYILLNRFLPGGRGLENTELLLNREEVNRMLDIAEEVLSRSGRYGHVGTELPLCIIDRPESYERLRIGTRCSAGKNFFVIDPGGYVKVCNHSPVRICRYDELDKLRDNPYWRTFQDSKYLPEMCRGCDKLGECDGGCREAAHVYSGSVSDKDPLFITD